MLADSIAATGAEAVLIGVPDVAVIPFASKGTVYFCLKTGVCPGIPEAGFPQDFAVDPSCAPAAAGGLGDTTLIPWTIGVARILQAAQGVPGSAGCTNDAEVVTGSELAAIHAAVDAFNSAIADEAAARGWAFVDVNTPLVAETAPGGRIPQFPDLSAVSTGGPVTFGPLFSLDGVHPSTTTHRILADSMISAVNRTYGTAIPFAGP
jgi:hypothetical protein